MSYELEALAKWIADPNRKPSDLAFTEGPARQVADRVRVLEFQVDELKVQVDYERERNRLNVAQADEQIKGLEAQVESLKAEVRGATEAHREAVASNDRMIRERDDANRINDETQRWRLDL